LARACRDEGRCKELGGGGAPYVLGSGRGRGSSVPRVEEEGSSARVVGARRGAPYGPRLGQGTRGGGIGGGDAPGLETTAALGRGQGCEATAGCGARRRKTRAQSNCIEEKDECFLIYTRVPLVPVRSTNRD